MLSALDCKRAWCAAAGKPQCCAFPIATAIAGKSKRPVPQQSYSLPIPSVSACRTDHAVPFAGNRDIRPLRPSLSTLSSSSSSSISPTSSLFGGLGPCRADSRGRSLIHRLSVDCRLTVCRPPWTQAPVVSNYRCKVTRRGPREPAEKSVCASCEIKKIVEMGAAGQKMSLFADCTMPEKQKMTLTGGRVSDRAKNQVCEKSSENPMPAQTRVHAPPPHPAATENGAE